MIRFLMWTKSFGVSRESTNYNNKWKLDDLIYFLRAIALHSRNWKHVADHMKDRTAESCRLKYARIRSKEKVQLFVRKYQGLKSDPEYYDLLVTAKECCTTEDDLTFEAEKQKRRLEEEEEMEKLYEQDNTWNDEQLLKMKELVYENQHRKPKSIKQWKELSKNFQGQNEGKSWISCRYKFLELCRREDGDVVRKSVEWKAWELQKLLKILGAWGTRKKLWDKIAQELGGKKSPTAIKLKYAEINRSKVIGNCLQ